VKDTTVLEGGVTETKFGSLEGSQAVPASPSGKGFVQSLPRTFIYTVIPPLMGNSDKGLKLSPRVYFETGLET
jgi:hypothetical protein